MDKSLKTVKTTPQAILVLTLTYYKMVLTAKVNSFNNVLFIQKCIQVMLTLWISEH